MIRLALKSDVDELITIGCALVKDKLGLRADRSKILNVIQTSMSSKSHRLLIADVDGKCEGALLLVSEPFQYAEKMYGQIICFFASTLELADELLKDMMLWVDTRRAIQLVNYSMPVKSSLDQVLLDNKFESTGSMLIWRRYGIL